MAILGVHIWAGRGSEPVGRRGPEPSPKGSLMTRGTCGAPSSKLIFPKKFAWYTYVPIEKSLALLDQIILIGGSK